MGNQICCDGVDNKEKESGSQKLITIDLKKTTIEEHPLPMSPAPAPAQPQPNLSELVPKFISQYLQINKPFNDQIKYSKNIKTIKFGKDNNKIYEGAVDEEGKPNGYGRLYLASSKSLLVGKFVKGAVQGSVHFVMENGSYSGNVENGQACDNFGIFKCQNYTYRGGIKNNVFDGQGCLEDTENDCKFQGIFRNGKKIEGTLSWKVTERTPLPFSTTIAEYQIQYTYEGKFDEQELFTGNGVLQCPKGVYKGGFEKGKKNGEGVFEFTNGLKYVGEYKNNSRDGYGIIYSKGEVVSYQGEFKNGLPHGIGKAPGKDGEMYESNWNQGITSYVEEDNLATH